MAALYLVRRLVVAAMLLLGAAPAAHAWSELEAALRLLPQPVDSAAVRPLFAYADLSGLRDGGDPADLLAVPLGDAGPALANAPAFQAALGVPPAVVRRVLHAGSAHRPLTVLWGLPGFTEDAGQRLAERGFAMGERDGVRVYARWQDDHLEPGSTDPGDPFAFSGQAQRILAYDEVLAGAIVTGPLEVLNERRRGAEPAVLARALLAAVAPMRAGLPGLRILQATAFWPDAFTRGEAERRREDPSRPVRDVPADAAPGSPRLPPFAFAIFAAAVLDDAPVLLLAVAYDDPFRAAEAAPRIADALDDAGYGEGLPASRVIDWVFQGRGITVAAATVLFRDAPPARASVALRHWLSLVDRQDFTPLDLVH